MIVDCRLPIAECRGVSPQKPGFVWQPLCTRQSSIDNRQCCFSSLSLYLSAMLVYVHVPFCARRCTYCDFAIAVRRVTPSDAFASTVLREWRLRQSLSWWRDSPDIETVYFGGGTPSRLEPAALKLILRGLSADRSIIPGAEVTLEANPDDVTPDRAHAWRALGVNRISLGVQSFEPTVLDWMHRTHTAGQADAAVRTLREAGFDNVSLDLIYGLPASLPRDWKADLTRALMLEPEHLSLYALTVEPATPLGKWTSRGAVLPLPENRVAEEYLLANELLGQSGFEHYEVSNAARPGYRARHNAGYWQRRPFIGLGPSAHSGASRERTWNIREWEAYHLAIDAGLDPNAGKEVLTDEQMLIEAQYLGLRTSEGAAASLIPDFQKERWMEQGWASMSGGRIRLTVEGWLRLDALVAAL